MDAPLTLQTDYMADLERDYDYKEEHFDFIQQSVRKFCLQYGLLDKGEVLLLVLEGFNNHWIINAPDIADGLHG